MSSLNHLWAVPCKVVEKALYYKVQEYVWKSMIDLKSAWSTGSVVSSYLSKVGKQLFFGSGKPKLA